MFIVFHRDYIWHCIFVGSAQKSEWTSHQFKIRGYNFGLKCEPGASLNAYLYLGFLVVFSFQKFQIHLAFNSPDHVQQFQTSQVPLAPCEFV